MVVVRFLVAALVVGCAAEPMAPPDREVVFNPASARFFDTPWPSDARVTDRGTPDWTGFPDPAGLPLVSKVIELASSRPGFATTAPSYLRVAPLPDPSELPTPEQTLQWDAAIQLIDITPTSPTFGERTPLSFETWDAPGAYVPGDLLAIAPVSGWPLRPRTTYALILTTDFANPVDVQAAGDDAWTRDASLVQAAAPTVGIDPERIAFGTTFTTLDPVEELEEVARFVRQRVEPPIFSQDVELVDDLEDYDVFRSVYTTPLLMTGTKPYATAGGAFDFRDDGLPEIAAWDRMRLSVVVPNDPEPAEHPNGWPVVVYLHGTGGDYRNFANSDGELEVGHWLTQLGAVGLGIDLPLHGTRGTADTSITLHSFNVLQPESALHIHRQAATDLLYLLEGIREAPTFRTPDGVEITLDPDRVVVIGHSQGGITAALALPWMGNRVKGVVLSGAGGQLAITAVERTSDFDIPTLIRTTLALDPDEALTETHPVLGLVQSIVERTDPINYARYWFHEDRALTGQQPVSVLLTTGLEDAQTPTRTAAALASAAWMPFAGRARKVPGGGVPEGMVLRGFDSTALPLKGNVEAWDGSVVTAGLSQWAKDDHFVIFTDRDASQMVQSFVVSALNSTPRIRVEPPPALEP